MNTSFFPIYNHYTTTYITFISLLWIHGICICTHPHTAYSDIYISPDGSDENTGTVEAPFASFERCRDEIRALKQNNQIPEVGLTVWMRGGDYVRTHKFLLTQKDSGTRQSPIEWKAYPNERVRIMGGVVLSGFEPVTDESIRMRLHSSVRDRVVQIDLHRLGIQDFGELRSRGFARNTTPSHGELFFDNAPMTLARWPNKGQWDLIAGFPADSGTDDGHGTTMGALEKGYFYESDRPSRWENKDQIWVHGYWAYDWANSYEQVTELNAARKLIRTAEPYGNYGFNKQQRFYFLNVLEEIDEPGEWYLDHTTGQLYFYPPDDIESAEVVFSILEEPAIQMVNTSHNTFRGIVFEAMRGNVIDMQGGEGNRIVSCLIRNIGNWAVLVNGGKNHGVIACDVFDTGDGGIQLTGGDRQTLTPGNHFVENCHFTRIGRWSKCYVPAVSMTGVGLRASHNLIHDHPHCAILFWGNDHLIEWNDIHHIALETGDVGAIYTGRDYTFRGNKIRHNYIHETGGVGMGSMGVYMDDCVSGTEVFGNVFYKAHWAMFIGGGRDHQVINNLFVECDPAIRSDGRGLDTKPVWRNMVDNTMRYRLADVPLTLYREQYPKMKTLDQYYGAPEGEPMDVFNGIPPEGNVIARNVCIGKWLHITWHARDEWFRVEDNFVSDDRNGIGGPESFFKILDDSPVWETGFQSIPVEKIGLLMNDDRKAIPTKE